MIIYGVAYNDKLFNIEASTQAGKSFPEDEKGSVGLC
jgi:hypothetical protein